MKKRRMMAGLVVAAATVFMTAAQTVPVMAFTEVTDVENSTLSKLKSGLAGACGVTVNGDTCAIIRTSAFEDIVLTVDTGTLTDYTLEVYSEPDSGEDTVTDYLLTEGTDYSIRDTADGFDFVLSKTLFEESPNSHWVTFAFLSDGEPVSYVECAIDYYEPVYDVDVFHDLELTVGTGEGQFLTAWKTYWDDDFSNNQEDVAIKDFEVQQSADNPCVDAYIDEECSNELMVEGIAKGSAQITVWFETPEGFHSEVPGEFTFTVTVTNYSLSVWADSDVQNIAPGKTAVIKAQYYLYDPENEIDASKITYQWSFPSWNGGMTDLCTLVTDGDTAYLTAPAAEDFTMDYDLEDDMIQVDAVIDGEVMATGFCELDFDLGHTLSTSRLYGYTRYETATTTADKLKTILGVQEFSCAVLASGKNFPDALAGSALAAQIDAPILLTNNASEWFDDDGLCYLLGNLEEGATVYLLGGTSAVSQYAEDTLTEWGYNVIRLAGKDRYETNMAIINSMYIPNGTDVVIVRGYTSYKTSADAKSKKNPQGYADSLSISGVAGRDGMPVFLADKGGLTTDQMNKIKAINPKHIYVIGGTSAVSDDVYAQVESLTNAEVERIAGATRYETSCAIAEKFFDASSIDTAVIAYGQNYPDGLTGGVLAAELGCPMLLAEDGKTSVQKTFLSGTSVDKLIFLGGENALPQTLVDDLAE